MIVVRPGELDTLARLERPVVAAGFRGAGSGTWELVEEIWIGIRDQLPSRGETTSGGVTVATRRSRVRMYWRDDVTTAMRLVAGSRVMQIVAGPAELGRRSGLEVMTEEYSSPGNPA